MQTLNLIQGSEEWKKIRSTMLVASEAPIIMGASPHCSRDEMLRMKTSGEEAAVTRWQQLIFDKGHESEDMARPHAEAYLGDSLYPVTGVREIEGLSLLASFDGINMMEDKPWEHKQFNQELYDRVSSGEELEPKHYWQLEHQLLVCEQEKTTFTVSDGTPENMAHCTYESRPERRDQLLEGWKLFLSDLENYDYEERAVQAIGTSPESLPAVLIHVTGAVTKNNLPVFHAHALRVIKSINTDLNTDQDFADAEKATKWCAEVESRMKSTKDAVLAQTADIDQVFKLLDDIASEARNTRLSLSKLVDKRKKDIRAEISEEAKDKWNVFLAEANEDLEIISFPDHLVSLDIAGAMKGKRTFETLRSAANDEVARARIEANVLIKTIQTNLDCYTATVGKVHRHLFNDLQSLSTESPEAFKAIIKARLSEFEEAQAEEKTKAEQEPPAISSEEAPIRRSVPAAQEKRPSDETILLAISEAFGVDMSVAAIWVYEMDASALVDSYKKAS